MRKGFHFGHWHQFLSPKPRRLRHLGQYVGGSVLSTRCWTGGTVRRYANNAFRSASVRLRKSAQGIMALIRVRLQTILQLHAGHYVQVVRTTWRGRYSNIAAGVGGQSLRTVNRIGLLKTKARLDAQLAKADRIHQIPSINTLVGIVIGGYGSSLAGGSIETQVAIQSLVPIFLILLKSEKGPAL